MITNIVDHRKNAYQWKSVWGVVESTWHDNSCKGSDKSPPGVVIVDYTTEPMPLSELLSMFSSKYDEPLTLYLYSTDPMGITHSEDSE